MERFNYDHLPDKLKNIGLFAPWNTAMRHGRLQKIPYKLNGEWASTTAMDRDFHDFDTAMNAFKSGNYKGIGVGITRGICAIDIDHCVKNGMISPLAQEILTLMAGCYIEISQSGEGLHLLFLTPPDMAYSLEQFFERNEEMELEVYISGYSGGRFIALTGQCYGGDLIEVDPMPILEKYMQRPIVEDPIDVTPVADMPDMDDFEIVEHMEKIPKAARLLDGDTNGYVSDSEAVEALIWCCLFWTDKSDQIERIIRNSRMRWERADDRRGGITLLRYSIERGRKKYSGQRYSGGQRSEKSKALDWNSEIGDGDDDPMMMDWNDSIRIDSEPEKAATSDPPDDDPNIMGFDDVIRVDSPSESDPHVEEITDKDHSTPVEAMAASTSETVSAVTSEAEVIPPATGEDTKDGKADFLKLFHPLSEFEEQEAEWFIPGWMPKGQITLVAADGGTGKTTTWVNILAAVSAGNRCILDPEGLTREPQKVAFATTEDSIRKKLLRKLKDAGANLENVIAMDLAADKDGLLRKFKFGSPLMELFVREVKPAVFVLDPVQGFIPPEINMGSRNAMRDCLAPLITLGEETGTTFVIIVHSNKRKGAFGRDRIADSADLWDIARSVVMMGYTDDAGIRYLSNEKNNYTALQETILYSINSNGQIVKEGTTWKRDRDFILGSAEAKTSPNRADCKDQIVQILTDAGGGMPTSEMDNKAHVSGYSWATIKRAKRELKDSKRISYFSTGSGRDGTLTWHTKLCDAPEETFDFNYIPDIDDSADGSELTLDHLTELPDEDVPF